MTMVSVADALKVRGIAQAADDAIWSPHTFVGQSGWRYPIFNQAGQHYTHNGEPVYRWKNADSQGKPKYAWIPCKPERARYYLLKDTVAAIKEANGFVYLASGEPDVLAYRAAGIRNVLCWFDGETSVPETFAADMHLLGVGIVRHFPDRDTTGMKSAAMVSKALEDSEIAYWPYALPFEMGSKGDVNTLWQKVSFDVTAFTVALMDAQGIDPQNLGVYLTADDAPKTTPMVLSANDHGLPPKFIQAVLADVERRDGFKRWKSNGWSSQFACPNTTAHSHGDQNHSAGFNRESMAFKCFVCGEMNAKQYGELVGIQLRDFFEDEPRPVNVGGLQVAPAKDIPPAQVDADSPKYTASDEAITRLIEELEGNRQPETVPMRFPLTSLHQFGGFAEVLWPGKMIAVMGVSGGGKTSFAESIVEIEQKAGHDSIWWGPEWDADEMAARSLQRQGGMSLTEVGKHRAWLASGNGDVGRPSSKARVTESLDMLREIKAWPGKVYHIHNDAEMSSMKAVLSVIETVVMEKRAAGRKVNCLFFDYIQRAPGGNTSWDKLEQITGAIKALCERLKLFGFILIQPTKGESKASRDGEMLTEGSGQGLSDQQFNLFLTMNPVYDANGEKLPIMRVNVVKNSGGRSGRKVGVYLKWAQKHLAVDDTIVDEMLVNAMKKAPDGSPDWEKDSDDAD